MTGDLSATGIAECVLCPRRANFRGHAPAHLETSAFAAIVRRALQRAADSRIAKQAYDLGYVLHDLLRERGVEGDNRLFERARDVTRFGLQTLYEFRPLIAQAEYGTSVAGIRVAGTIDLIAESADGTIFAFAFRTGDVPASTLEIELGFAHGGVSDTYANATCAVLDLYDNRAVVREASPPDQESLEYYARHAIERKGDDARPGSYCRACDFLERCPEGRAAREVNVSESAAIVSSEPIARDAYEAYLLAHGAERSNDEEFLLTTDRGTIWISHGPGYLTYIAGVTEGLLDTELGAEPAFCCDVSITTDAGSDRLAMEFAIAFLDRWPCVVYDYAATTFGVKDLRERLARGDYLWKPEPR